MSRQNSIIIILAVILLLVGGFVFFYFSNNQNKAVTTSGNVPSTSNPFGNTSQNKPSTTGTQGQPSAGQTGGTSVKNLAKLIEIYRNPTSGSMFFTNRSNQDSLRFVDRAVGNTYEYVPSTQTGEPVRLTNTTIPKIQESVWSSTGNNLVLRYLDDDTDDINSFSAKINVSTSSNSSGDVSGVFLPSNLKQLAINPAGNKIFGLLDKSDKSGSYGITTNLDGSGKKTVLDSPVSYWNISWPKESVIAMTTKPNYTDNGFLFFFNPQTGSMSRILGNIIGMSTVVNSDASLVAYSYTTSGSFKLDIFDVTNKISKNYSIVTLADKCVWGNSNNKILYCAVPKTVPQDNYPDAWYQGTETLSDDIWSIDSQTGESKMIYQIGSNENAEIDAMNLVISPSDEYLAFMNKSDLSLWLLQIK